MIRRVLFGISALSLVLALSACQGSDEPKKPDYEPIADATLFAQITALPGVSKSTVHYQDSVGNSNSYIGDIIVDADADGVAILDQAIAILRQGAPRATMTVSVVQGSRQISTIELGLSAPTNDNLTERYGPQPGDGTPPAA